MKMNKKEIIRIVILYAAIGMAFSIILKMIFSFVILRSKVISGSMEPFLMTNEIVYANRLAYLKDDIKRGDVIGFNDEDILEDEPDAIFVKRVIGLPGDRISFEDGHVYVNDEMLDESEYISSDMISVCDKTFCVPDGQFFVLGDNRTNSKDSRYFEYPFIDRNKIIGKFLVREDFWREMETSIKN